MRRLVGFALIFTFLSEASVALAAGPLEESGRRAIQQLAQAQGQPSNKKTFLWTGGALLGAGVALLAVTDHLPGDPQGNFGYAFLGVGIAGVGATLMIVGAFKSTSIQIRPNSVGYRVRF